MEKATTANGNQRPYKPSWVDRFTQWIENLPGPAWVFYVGFSLALILVQVPFLWLGGGQHAEALLPLVIYNGLLIPFALGLIHLLDNQAVTALNVMRPTLEMTEPEFDRFQYRLSTMPFPASLLTGLIMTLFVILMEQLSTLPVRYAALEHLPVFAIVYHIVDKSSAFLLGVIIYHTIRQLWLVNTLNSNYTRINLFELGPLQAISKLTASTAVGLVVGVYGWMLINPDLLADPVSLGAIGGFTLLAVAVFVWPLLGTHRRMEMEKQRALHELDLCFQSVFSRFNRQIQDGEYAATERLNGTIASLEIQYKRIAAIPTWPWRPETARFVLAAIALPLILTILQFLAERAF